MLSMPNTIQVQNTEIVYIKIYVTSTVNYNSEENNIIIN